MDDLEAQLRRLAEHRGAQAADVEVATTPALWIRRRRGLLVAAVVLVVAGGAVGWLVTQDGQGDTVVVAPASTTSSTTAATPPPTSTVATRSFESRLGFTVELPAEWAPDTTPVLELFLDALVGADSEFFRARGWDRPDRSAFADWAEPNLPDLDQAAQDFAAIFPEEFGLSPRIEKTSTGLPAGMIIRPSADAATPNGITYLLEPPVWVPLRFIEVVVDKAHAVELMESFTWLPEPADSAELELPTTSLHLSALDYDSDLSFAVRLPAGWRPDTNSSVADEWVDSFIGPDGGIFRTRLLDRPDRSPFVDSVEPNLPDLEEVVQEMVALFPLEFGNSPVVQTIEFEGRIGWRIDPSEDAPDQAGITVLLDGPRPSVGRFIEVLISEAHFEEIFSSFHYL